MDNIICKLCGKECLYLGSHLWFKHKMKAREYKEMYGLDYNYPLISPEVQAKKRVAFEADREKYIANLKSNGSKYWFKKGTTNKQRVSQQSIDRYLGQLEVINKNSRGKCPVCKMVFNHLKSHLYNAHGLVMAKK